MNYSDELFVVSLSLSLIQRTLSIHLLNPALFQEGFSICKFSHFSLHLFFSSLNFELNLNVYVFCYLYIIVQSIFPTDSMSTQGGSTLSLSSSLTPRWKHDVFLSFRGEDTRNSFTDHLYTALKQKGILTFKYDEKIERGKAISREIVEAIEESRFSIVILSKNYASSIWCLDELVQIIRCSKERGVTVLPVFYDVDPSDVRRQRGTFLIPFVEYMEKIEMWRAALTEVANLSGWLVQDG